MSREGWHLDTRADKEQVGDPRLTVLGKRYNLRQGIWHMPVTPALKRQRQEDRKFQVSLGYIEFEGSLHCIVRSCLKKILLFCSVLWNLCVCSLDSEEQTDQ
jgi:hypothetical protein